MDNSVNGDNTKMMNEDYVFPRSCKWLPQGRGIIFSVTLILYNMAATNIGNQPRPTT